MDLTDPVPQLIMFLLGLFTGYYFRDSIDWALIHIRQWWERARG